ncbi:MAG: hypothetical protein NXI10_02220, partial [bacterium]|nr:hypothetical protein [bacterium]
MLRWTLILLILAGASFSADAQYRRMKKKESDARGTLWGYWGYIFFDGGNSCRLVWHAVVAFNSAVCRACPCGSVASLSMGGPAFVGRGLT